MSEVMQFPPLDLLGRCFFSALSGITQGVARFACTVTDPLGGANPQRGFTFFRLAEDAACVLTLDAAGACAA